MFAHPPRPRKSSCTHVVTRMCRVCGVYMLTLLEPDAYARPLQRVCSSRVTLKYVTLTLTRLSGQSAEYGHAFSYSSRFQTRTACILVLCIVHHRTLVGSGHQTHMRAGRLAAMLGAQLGCCCLLAFKSVICNLSARATHRRGTSRTVAASATGRRAACAGGCSSTCGHTRA